MTKLLTIGLLLLSCGVVDAQQDLYTDCLHKAPDGKTYDICRMPDMRKILDVQVSPKATEPNTKMWYVDPQLGVMFTSPCEQKMKEAMKLAQKHQDNLFTQLNWKTTEYSGAYSGIRCVTVECLQKELDEAKAAEKAASELKQAKIRWDSIYKECVQ